jgi:site-specific DNA-methyltransferase (adenine-specific)
MTPYYDDGTCVIYHGDCFDLLHDLDGVGAVITDPPYSSGGAFRGDRAKGGQKYLGWAPAADGPAQRKEYPDFTGDTRDQRGYLVWSSIWMTECQRILKPGGTFAVFTDWRQLPTTTDAVQAAGLVWRAVAVWDKGVGRPVRGRFRNHVEYVIWATNGPHSDPQAGPPHGEAGRSCSRSAHANARWRNGARPIHGERHDGCCRDPVRPEVHRD